MVKKCCHKDLFPDVKLQFKMAKCGHFLIHGYWECRKCKEWIKLELDDEWEGREGTTTKCGKYQYQRIDGKNKMVYIK